MKLEKCKLLVLIIVYSLTLSVSQVNAGGLSDEEILGSSLYSDTNLSLNRNQACASCHDLDRVKLADGSKFPAPGFVDPINVISGSPTSAGSVAGRFGNLNAPSVGYAAFSPTFFFNAVDGLWVGGQFWNGRAATLEEQAKQPFLNPVEMAMPSPWAVISVIKENLDYVEAFLNIYGFDLNTVPYNPLAPASEIAPASVDAAFQLTVNAIAAFERTSTFNQFSSKFDAVALGLASYTAQEQAGRTLFESKAQCSLCHVLDPATGPDGALYPAVFTDFTYDNIGIPRNLSIPGIPTADIGLSATTGDPGDDGKHKVMSLRNIELTAPYGHNGFFRTLEHIVHFYNTRDVPGAGWAPPEVVANVNVTELGNLGLTPEEEQAVVAFMKTLTDGYVP